MSSGPRFTRLKTKDLFRPEAQDPKPKILERCPERVPGAAQWERLPKTLLGLNATRQESLGARRDGQSLPASVGSQAGGVPSLSPTSHASPQMAEQGHLPALELQFTAQHTAPQFALHVPQP